MQRIYLPQTDFSDILEISQKELYHQITRVMRARVGQMFVFFDGITCRDYSYEIVWIDGKKVILELREIQAKDAEISFELSLFQALPNKLEKWEYIIQKSAEIWYRHIYFFQAERSQILKLSESKKERLKKIAVEAIEQCGGNIIPDITFLTETMLEKNEKHLFLVCHTEKSSTKIISDISLQGFEKISVIVGPEGWFSPQEIEYFQSQGAQVLCFWNRILRTETVAPLLWFYLTQKKEA